MGLSGYVLVFTRAALAMAWAGRRLYWSWTGLALGLSRPDWAGTGLVQTGMVLGLPRFWGGLVLV